MTKKHVNSNENEHSKKHEKMTKKEPKIVPLRSKRAPTGTPEKHAWSREELPRRPLSDLDEFSSAPEAQKHCILQGFREDHQNRRKTIAEARILFNSFDFYDRSKTL